MDILTLSMAKKYTNLALLGFTDVVVNGTTITFTFQDGSTESMTFPTPADGKSITGVNIDADGALICTLSDGSTLNAGTVPAVKGDTGERGERGETGADGKSAYDVWLEQGNTGSEADFLESLKGERGEKGDAGFNPVVTVTDTDNGHKVSIEDSEGVKEFEVLDGVLDEILHTDLTGFDGVTTVLGLVNAMVTEYRALSTKKPIRFVCGDIGKATLTDLPQNYGLLQIIVAGYDVVEVSFAGSSYGFKTLHLGTVNRTSGEELFSSIAWQKPITEKSSTDPYSCSGYTALTGTEDLFTLPCGHYASANINTAYNYPVTDTDTTAHIYVLGCLNDPANNKGYRVILYFDNKGRAYRINEWWGSFSSGWKEIATKSYHRVVVQGTSGYAKIKAPTKDNELKITVTDNYGGSIEITGMTTTNAEYKPFKAIRTSNGNWYSDNAGNAGNNKIQKVYYYDGYLYVLLATYTTAIITGVTETPTVVDTLENTDTEIPIVSLLGYGLDADLELPKGKKVVTSLGKSTYAVGQQILQDTDFTTTDGQARFEIVTKNAENSSNGKHQIAQAYQITPIEGGTNASTSYIVYEDGRAQLTMYPHTNTMPRNDYNIVCEGYLKEYVDSKIADLQAQIDALKS